MSQPKPGRPRKSEKYGGHIVAAEDLIADRLPELIDNLFRLAAGVEVQKADANGVERVYSQPPDRQANVYLIDRILGKPTERVEHTGDDGGPIEVEATMRERVAAELEQWRKSMMPALPPPTPTPTNAP